MSMLGKVFHALRVWLGLADASESHLTPDYGWLLPVPVEARRHQEEWDARRDARVRSRSAQA
jgi:hypothetical protein